MAYDSSSGNTIFVVVVVKMGVDTGSVNTERIGRSDVFVCSIGGTSSKCWSFLLYSAINLAFLVFFGIAFVEVR